MTNQSPEREKLFSVAIPGYLQQQERHRSTIRRGTIHSYEPPASKKAKQYIREMLMVKRAIPMHPVKGDVAVQLEFFEALPPRKQPKDLDNYVKLWLDAMNKLVYEDDIQVVEMMCRVTRKAPDPRTILTVWRLV